MTSSLKGTYTALITPLIDDKLDEEGLLQLLQRQKENNIEGILLFGSTGEGEILTFKEKEKIIKIARQFSPTWPLIVSTTAPSTQAVIEHTQWAADQGANFALIASPYYVRPTQEGLFRHFEAIAASSPLPIIVYNIEKRCGVNIETSTLKRIATLPSIIGVKEASNQIVQIMDVIHEIKLQRPSFSVLSGDDGLTFPLLCLGGDGVISILSNLLPAKIKALVDACIAENFPLGRFLHNELFPLFKALYAENNPILIKEAMRLVNLPSGSLRLPLVPLSQLAREKLALLLEKKVSFAK